MADDLELIFLDKSGTLLGEGPWWDVREQLLYWVDIEQFRVHIWNPRTRENETINVGQYVGCVVPRTSGGFLLALQKGIFSYDKQSGALVQLINPETDKPTNRFNDGKCDRRGRFWAGTLELAEKEPLGALYCVETDMKVRRVVTDIYVSNGIAWSPDNTIMYYIDSPLKRIDAFDFEAETGCLSNRRTVVRIQDGFPDGMTVDCEGMLWVAHWGGGAVTRWDPSTGELLRKVTLPCSLVTSVMFGGPALSELYITTASRGIDKNKEPHAGALFCLKNPGIRGLPETPFAG